MNSQRPQRLLWLALILTLCVSMLTPTLDAQAQDSADAKAAQTLNYMTPEERVGQLFLVTFSGTDASSTSVIYSLIVDYHVGGVTFLAGNDNFASAGQAVPETQRLIHDLQEAEWESSSAELVDPITGEATHRNYIPLFIALSQDGGGAGHDQILDGLTPMPSLMSIGATWNPDLASQAGTVMGQELSDLGFNLYFGPSLDVMESVDAASRGDPDAQTFGGDPYWVGRLGRAYVSGLHTGSNGRLILAAKHFPGRGGSDRPPDEEVPTVRKSLEQLKQIELAPFFSVTGTGASEAETVDALLVSHIRYQGFQGNIRATTRPVSFDPQALGQILALQPFATWREQGGLVISDDLSSHAVRQFYDPAGSSFQARIVARDALLAGNDLLNIGNLVSSDAPDNYTTLTRCIAFFAQKYREDPAFANRVDDAVFRILRSKYQLYPRFSLSAVQVAPEALERVGGSSQVTFEVARQAATLISPDNLDLDTLLPEPPSPLDRQVFITDSSLVSQCNACPPQPTLAVDALQQAVLRLYAPPADVQASAGRLSSYSFEELALLLDGSGGEALEADLRRTDYVILSLVDSKQNQPRTLRRFLAERQDLLRNKRVILFSFGAPFYLDTTDITKLTAYYALYSKTAPFVEVAARILYKELSPQGNSPVSVPGIGYDLITVTAPDPQQVIPLSLDLPPTPTPAADSTPQAPEPTPVPLFNLGDNIAIRTGQILDYNGHPVPDGTVVSFSLEIISEGGGLMNRKESITLDGIARTSFKLEKPGLLEIRAYSEPALISDVLQLDVSQGAAAVTVVAPTDATPPSIVLEPSLTPESETENAMTAGGYPMLGGWLVAVLVLACGSWGAYWYGKRMYTRRWGLRWALCVLLGGLVAFNYLALGLPGSKSWVLAGGMATVLGLTILGQMAGWGAVWLWLQKK